MLAFKAYLHDKVDFDKDIRLHVHDTPAHEHIKNFYYQYNLYLQNQQFLILQK